MQLSIPKRRQKFTRKRVRNKSNMSLICYTWLENDAAERMTNNTQRR